MPTTSKKNVRGRKRSVKSKNKDRVARTKRVIKKVSTRAREKTDTKLDRGKRKRIRKTGLSLIHCPEGFDGSQARPLNTLMTVAKTQELGCRFCKFFQFSAPNGDLREWRKTAIPNIEHECSTWGVLPRGDSVKTRDEYSQFTLKFKCAPEKCDVLFIGEAPGAAEDSRGYAFVGNSGRLMHELLHADTKIGDKFVTRFTNVIRCQPWNTPDGGQKNPTLAEARYCAGFLTNEIVQTEPKMIVTLGALALKTVFGSTGATLKKLDGRIQKLVIEDREVFVFPLYHPAYILRNDHLTPKYIKSLKKLERYLKEIKATGTIKASKARKAKYEIVCDFKRALRIIKGFRESKKKFAYDIETKASFVRRNGKSYPNLHTRKVKIALVGLCNTPGVAYCIPYFHVEVKWTKAQRKKIRKALVRLLEDPEIEKVAQNKKFDNTAFEMYWDAKIPWTAHDTMTDHYILDEEPGTHGLDHLSYEYTPKLAGYKEKIVDAERRFDYDFTRIPLKDGGEYNCLDADATLQISNILDKKLEKDPQLWRVAKNFLRRATPALGTLERNGAMIDLDAAERVREKYVRQNKKIDAELFALPAIQRYQAFRRRKIIQARKSGPDARKTYKGRMSALSAGERKQLKVNLSSVNQIRDILYTHLGYPVSKKTKNNAAATDKSVLIQFAAKYKCRFCELLMERRLNKLIVNTYIDTIVHDVLRMRDGLLHGSFLLHVTVTGRSSSQDPNMQNFPNKGGGDVKRLFISRFNSPYEERATNLLRKADAGELEWDYVIDELRDVGVILDYDYSQIELRILAVFSRDPTMLRIYRDGGDIHLETTLAIFNMSRKQWDALDKGEKKRRRTIAKRVNFGVIYGSGAKGICELLAKENPPIYIEVEEAEQFIVRLFKKYKGAKKWIDNVLARLHKHGELRTVMGRLRRLPEIDSVKASNQKRAERQGPNALIQSAASDITITALTLITELFQIMAKESGLESAVILTIHDSIVFDCKLGEVKQVAEAVEEIMSNISKYGSIIWGDDFDWEWLTTIPVSVDGEIGPNYRDKYEFGQLDPSDPNKIYKAFATSLLGDGKEKNDLSRFVGSLERDEKDFAEAGMEAVYG